MVGFKVSILDVLVIKDSKDIVKICLVSYELEGTLACIVNIIITE